MNILYLSADRGIPIRGHKGAAVHVRSLTEAFARLGHNVTILTPRPGPADGPVPAAQLIEVPLPSLCGELDEQTAIEHQGHTYNRLLFAFAQEHIRQGAYDLIYERHALWSDVGSRLSQATGLPLILEVNAPLREEAARYRNLTHPELAALIENRQFQKAHAISVVSSTLREFVIAQGASPDRVAVLPNAIDPDQFHPAVRGGRVRSLLALNSKTVIGFVGRPRPWHDLDTLLLAFSRLYLENQNFHLLLVGQMPEDLSGKIAGLGLPALSITQTGAVPHKEIPEYLAAMDVAVSPHPALNDFYFSPLKLFEYLACGVPTIATEIGQPAEIMQNGQAGLLYPPGDAYALAANIRWLVEHPAEAREIAWQGATYVLENHTWEQNARTVIEWATLPGSADTPRQGTGVLPLCASHPVELPILDRKLRQRLYRATRADLALPFLAQALPAFQKRTGETLEEIEHMVILKYKPARRCVLAYSLRGKTRSGVSTRHPVIGKVFRDERGENLLTLQQYLWDNGFASSAPDRIFVPQPLAYIPPMRMMVQAFAPGITYNDLVAESGRQAADLAYWTCRCAQALVKLHHLPIPQAADGKSPAWIRSPYLLDDERASLDRFTEGLLEMRPLDGSRVTALRDVLQSWAAQLNPAAFLTPVHRDFYYSQILFDQQDTSLIDFDLFTVGDPAIDVANFIAHLYFLGLDRFGDLNALADEADRFLDAYSRGRLVDRWFLERVAFYQAATFFRLLHVVAPRPGLQQHFYTLYNHAASCLEFA